MKINTNKLFDNCLSGMLICIITYLCVNYFSKNQTYGKFLQMFSTTAYDLTLFFGVVAVLITLKNLLQMIEVEIVPKEDK